MTKKRTYTQYANRVKARFIKLNIDKYMRDATAAKSLDANLCADTDA